MGSSPRHVKTMSLYHRLNSCEAPETKFRFHDSPIRPYTLLPLRSFNMTPPASKEEILALANEDSEFAEVSILSTARRMCRRLQDSNNQDIFVLRQWDSLRSLNRYSTPSRCLPTPHGRSRTLKLPLPLVFLISKSGWLQAVPTRSLKRSSTFPCATATCLDSSCSNPTLLIGRQRRPQASPSSSCSTAAATAAAIRNTKSHSSACWSLRTISCASPPATASLPTTLSRQHPRRLGHAPMGRGRNYLRIPVVCHSQRGPTSRLHRRRHLIWCQPRRLAGPPRPRPSFATAPHRSVPLRRHGHAS